MDARSRNHSCRERAKRITYSECVLVALLIQHAMRMLQIVNCDLPDSTTFFSHYLTYGTIFQKRKTQFIKLVLNFVNKLCVFIFCTIFL